MGLKGQGDEELSMLTEWLCPPCYVYPQAVTPELSKIEKVVKSYCDKVLAEVKKNSLSPEKVVTEIKKNALSPEMIKATVDEAVSIAFNKNTADTKKAITETLQQENAQVITEVMKSSKQKMDGDAVARDQRKCNVTVKNVPESTHRAGHDRQAEDWRFALKILKINEGQLVRVVRAGPPIGSRPNDTRVTRVMVITVDSPETANHLTNYGRGWRRQTTDGQVMWVNPDLIKADRDANYRARQLAKNRRPGRGEFVTVDEVNGSIAVSPVAVHAARQPLLEHHHDDSMSIISDDISIHSQEDHNESARSQDHDMPVFV